MFSQISASVIDGLLIGFVYGIAAMGLSLIWGVMRVINLAHGATMALGMFCIYFSSPMWESIPTWGCSWWWSWP